MLQLINNHENMLEVCQDENNFRINEEPIQGNEEEIKSLEFQSMRANIERVIQDCKNIVQE